MIDSKTPEWPSDRLKSVLNCPVCGAENRNRLYADLTDVTFFAAAGHWDLWRCHSCASAWLDPRPTEESIGDAYSAYYTHQESVVPQLNSEGLRHRLGNGYRNWRFGTSMQPSSALGRYAAVAVPSVREAIDASYRYLPRLPRTQNKRLLDIGCGNGEFLSHAASAGWQGAGVEPDTVSRAMAISNGFEVRETLRLFAQGGMFDAVSMSHVIEHLHDPLSTLRAVCHLLRPGGTIYVATPNIDGVGHRMYGRNWRGLEAPRHLVLFNRSSLEQILAEAGFCKSSFHPSVGALEFTQLQSRRIAAGNDPYRDGATISGPEPTKAQYDTALRPGSETEFLVVTAMRS